MGDFYESREWLDLRYRVLQKSGGSCKLCGCRASSDNPLQVDHIKPRSKHPELALVESNMQVLCKNCNQGKSNKDVTDWRFRASRELIDKVNRKTAILGHATAEQRGKLEQLGWLAKNDPSFHKEAEKQYKALWQEIEADWLATGGGG
jgi:5-methylcytosine-specific restriction endonuclease McrA